MNFSCVHIRTIKKVRRTGIAFLGRKKKNQCSAGFGCSWHIVGRQWTCVKLNGMTTVTASNQKNRVSGCLLFLLHTLPPTYVFAFTLVKHRLFDAALQRHSLQPPPPSPYSSPSITPGTFTKSLLFDLTFCTTLGTWWGFNVELE